MKTINRREFISGAAALGVVSGCRMFDGTRYPSGKPELTVGVISDVHQPVAGTERLQIALSFFDRRKVDAVLVCGDLTHYGLVRELKMFRDQWTKAFPDNRRSDGEKVEPLFIYGDHDTGGYCQDFDNGEPPCRLHGIDREQVRKELIPLVGSGKAWKEVFGEDWDFVQIKDVKGYRFILSHYYGTIHQQVPPGLEEKFNEAVSGISSDRPFFFVQHRVYPNTVTAYPWNNEWWCADCDAANKLLERHPNAVALCGHAHSNLLDEGNFWRGDFTAIEVPTLHTLSYPHSLGMDRNTFDTRSVQCLVMKVYPHGVVFERHEARENTQLGADWRVILTEETSLR